MNLAIGVSHSFTVANREAAKILKPDSKSVIHPVSKRKATPHVLYESEFRKVLGVVFLSPERQEATVEGCRK